MKATIIKDSDILIPNQDHQTFTFTGRVIKEGTEVKGDPCFISAKRRGQPFVYRLFKTNQGDYIFLNTIKEMKGIEVTLSADGEQTVVLEPKVQGPPILAILVGAGAGFALGKYRNSPLSTLVLFTVGGALLGATIYSPFIKSK